MNTPLVSEATREARGTDRFLSPEQVAEVAPGVTVTVLENRRKQGLKPDFFKPTGATGKGAVLYLESEIRAWVMAARVTTRESSS